jgi:polyribonucleotide nucleotidyltransferase
MKQIITRSVEIDGKQLSFELGRVAKQADGSTVVRLGDTMVLVTACAESKIREGVDFLPLTVDYRENTYAGGRIPGGFFKREGRPTERDLTCRLIDRGWAAVSGRLPPREPDHRLGDVRRRRPRP